MSEKQTDKGRERETSFFRSSPCYVRVFRGMSNKGDRLHGAGAIQSTFKQLFKYFPVAMTTSSAAVQLCHSGPRLTSIDFLSAESGGSHGRLGQSLSHVCKRFVLLMCIANSVRRGRGGSEI